VNGWHTLFLPAYLRHFCRGSLLNRIVVRGKNGQDAINLGISLLSGIPLKKEKLAILEEFPNGSP
jgi:hypothetical protein